MNWDYEDENCKIKIYPKTNKGNLLANATVSLNTVVYGFTTIKNFQIWRSRLLNSRLNEYINIVPTSINRFTQVFFENEDGWFLLEKTIFNVFSDVSLGKEEIDIDEIDKALSK